MRKKTMLLLIIVMIPLLTGCWSRVEVNDLSIVTAAAIDKMEDGSIRITLQITIPRVLGQISGGGSGGVGGERKPTVTVSSKGETVLEASRKLHELPRKLFFSHSRIIIIGEKMARDGVSPILDVFSRSREARLNSFILFTTGEAVDILTIPPKWEKISAEEIRKEEKLQTGMSVHFNDFVDMLLADGVEPIAARVGPKYSEVMNKSDSGSEDSSHKLEKSIGITGAAVFHKDKLIGWMNDKEARGVKWLRNEIKDAVVTVNIPNEMGGGKISLRVLKANTKLKPIMIDNKVKMEVEVLAEHDLHENSSKLDLSNPEVIQYVDEKLRDNITERLQLVLDKAQKQFKSDIFGFGLAVYRSYPKEWKKQFKNRWDQEFPNLEVKITPHVKVVRTGLTNKSLTWEE